MAKIYCVDCHEPFTVYDDGKSLRVKYCPACAPRHAPTPRVCLTCNQEFASTGPGNRICPGCANGKNRGYMPPQAGNPFGHRKGKAGDS